VQCTTNNDCTSSYAPGSTCNSSHACQCRRQSTGNILTNPGFETSLSGWTSVNNCSTCPILENWTDKHDSDSCPGSGSVSFSYYGFAFGGLTQCVAVSGNTFYRFGYRFKQASSGDEDAALCTVSSYSSTNCSGNTIDSMNYYSGPASTSWANPSLSTQFSAASSARSIRVTCQQTKLTDTWVDQVYLNAASNSY